jgi:hypothetical protein
MYGRKSESTYQPMGAGIHQNVLLKSITFEPMSNTPGMTATNVLRYNFFKPSDGTSFTHTEFPVDEKKLRELAKSWAKGKTAEEKNAEIERIVESEYDSQTRRIEHIGQAFVPDFVCPEANSWEAFARAVIDVIGETHKEAPVHLKIVYNKKDYEIFPKYVAKGFIQPASAPMKLAIDPKYDRIEPLPVKDSSASASFDDDDGVPSAPGVALDGEEEF